MAPRPAPRKKPVPSTANDENSSTPKEVVSEPLDSPSPRVSERSKSGSQSEDGQGPSKAMAPRPPPRKKPVPSTANDEYSSTPEEIISEPLDSPSLRASERSQSGSQSEDGQQPRKGGKQLHVMKRIYENWFPPGRNNGWAETVDEVENMGVEDYVDMVVQRATRNALRAEGGLKGKFVDDVVDAVRMEVSFHIGKIVAKAEKGEQEGPRRTGPKHPRKHPRKRPRAGERGYFEPTRSYTNAGLSDYADNKGEDEDEDDDDDEDEDEDDEDDEDEDDEDDEDEDDEDDEDDDHGGNNPGPSRLRNGARNNAASSARKKSKKTGLGIGKPPPKPEILAMYETPSPPPTYKKRRNPTQPSKAAEDRQQPRGKKRSRHSPSAEADSDDERPSDSPPRATKKAKGKMAVAGPSAPPGRVVASNPSPSVNNYKDPKNTKKPGQGALPKAPKGTRCPACGVQDAKAKTGEMYKCAGACGEWYHSGKKCGQLTFYDKEVEWQCKKCDPNRDWKKNKGTAAQVKTPSPKKTKRKETQAEAEADSGDGADGDQAQTAAEVKGRGKAKRRSEEDQPSEESEEE